MKEITLDAKVESIAAVTALAEETLEQVDCPLRTQMQINVAIDELVGNIVHYAYPEGEGVIKVQCGVDPETRVFTLVLQDRGIAFNPLDTPEPDVSKSVRERTIGGLGIFLARRAMDEITYSREEGWNILCSKKKV